MPRILIIGAGAQAAIVAEILGDAAVGMVEDHALFPEHDAVIVAIGDNRARRAISERLAHENFATAIHPFTSIARSATVGDGAMICAGAIVTPRAAIGRGVLLNTKSSVDHDSVIGDFAHVAPGATIGGRCRIGEETLIGPGATVASGVTIGARVVVGAGAVVLRDLPDDVVAWGVPARIMR
jgi:sugar O-acyltransferase (sialic acid O-acetyltransferase NeuD family)